jgi:hypothetical protein
MAVGSRLPRHFGSVVDAVIDDPGRALLIQDPRVDRIGPVCETAALARTVTSCHTSTSDRSSGLRLASYVEERCGGAASTCVPT